MADDSDEFDPLNADDDGLDTELIVNQDDLSNIAVNDDYDEGHRELFNKEPSSPFNIPVAGSLGKLALGGDSSVAQSHRKEAMRMMAELDIQSGMTVIQSDGENPPYVVRTRLLEDNTSIKVTSNGALSHTEIETPVHEIPPEFDSSVVDVEEPIKSFRPFFWVGLHHVSGGNTRFPEVSGHDVDTVLAAPHLLVWEPINPDLNGGRTHQIISNRNTLVSPGARFNPVRPDEWSNAEALLADEPSDIYPDGPSVSDSKDPDTRDKSSLEVWMHPRFGKVNDDGINFDLFSRNIPPRSDTADLNEDDYWDVIIRSRRLSPDSKRVTDFGGGGSKTAHTGDYSIKVMMIAVTSPGVNIFGTKYRMYVRMGGGIEHIYRIYEFQIEGYSTYLMHMMPGGFFEFQFPWRVWNTTEDLGTERGVQNFLKAYDHMCPIVYLDDGSNNHGPWWWDSGVRATMPPPQNLVPESQFAHPEIFEPSGDDKFIPKVTTHAKPFTGNAHHERRRFIGASQSLDLSRITYTRVTLQTTLGLVAFSGDQAKSKHPDFAPEGCPSEPPTTVTMTRPFDGDPLRIPIIGSSFYPGVYHAVNGSSTITVEPGVSPGNGINYWQESSCYGGKADVIIFVQLDNMHQGIQDLIDAELNPLVNPMIMYLKSISSRTPIVGDDWGDGQKSTSVSLNSVTFPSSEAEWFAAGGFGGYFSAQFRIDNCITYMDAF